MKSSRIYIAEGIVLKRTSYGEADRILTVFTKQYGKIRVIAKGVRKITSRRAGHIEVFSRVTLSLHASSSGMDTLTEAQAVHSDKSLASDMVKMGYAYCLCELVDQLLAERQEHRDVYELLVTSLDELRNAHMPDEWQQTMSGFVHQLLWVLGFLPATRTLDHTGMRSYIEHITERKLRAWPDISNLRDRSGDDTIGSTYG